MTIDCDRSSPSANVFDVSCNENLLQKLNMDNKQIQTKTTDEFGTIQ